jgi:hypothetical protein
VAISRISAASKRGSLTITDAVLRVELSDMVRATPQWRKTFTPPGMAPHKRKGATITGRGLIQKIQAVKVAPIAADANYVYRTTPVTIAAVTGLVVLNSTVDGSITDVNPTSLDLKSFRCTPFAKRRVR